MKSQQTERILLQNTASLASIRSLVEGYILNCRCEARSQATVTSYQYRLMVFCGFVKSKRPSLCSGMSWSIQSWMVSKIYYLNLSFATQESMIKSEVGAATVTRSEK
jgi:hypothetical protein